MSRTTREQQRAERAYTVVAKVPKAAQKEYKALAESFGAFVLKNGLCAAMAFVQRSSNKDARTLYLEHLAGAGVPGVVVKKDGDLFAAVRGLDLPAYMLATREVLAFAVWLKRAAQASFNDSAKDTGASDA